MVPVNVPVQENDDNFVLLDDVKTCPITKFDIRPCLSSLCAMQLREVAALNVGLCKFMNNARISTASDITIEDFVDVIEDY